MCQQANRDGGDGWDAQNLGDVGSADKLTLMVMGVLDISFVLFVSVISYNAGGTLHLTVTFILLQESCIRVKGETCKWWKPVYNLGFNWYLSVAGAICFK